MWCVRFVEYFQANSSESERDGIWHEQASDGPCGGAGQHRPSWRRGGGRGPRQEEDSDESSSPVSTSAAQSEGASRQARSWSSSGRTSRASRATTSTARTRVGKIVQYKPADTMEFVRIDSGRVTGDGEIIFTGPRLLEEDLRPLTDLELATALAECAERGVGLGDVGFTAEMGESEVDDTQTASTSARTPQRAGPWTEAPSFTTSTPRKDRSYTEPDLQLTVVSNPRKPM